MNFYKRHLGDYSKHTPHLSMIEHGAYSLLLDYCYATEKPLPLDMDAIYRICRAISKQEQQAVRSVVDQFFPVLEDGLRHNKRCDKELAKASRQRDVNREIGKRGGRPKKTEEETDSVIECITELETDSVCFPEPNDNPSQTPDSIDIPPTPLADAKGVNGHAKRRKKPKSACPQSMEITDEMYDWANGKGLTDEQVTHETEAMIAWHTGKGTEWSDWKAAWRTWMLNAVKFSRARSARQ